MVKVLVTGGSGLVGKALQKLIGESDEWVFLSSADADLRSFEQCQNIFEKYKPTYVIHLAAIVGGLFYNMAAGADFFDGNIRMAINAYKAAHEYRVQKLVSCLSTCIFPDSICQTGQPIDETMLHDGPPHSSNEGYSYAKRMLDILNRTYASQHGRQYTSVILTNIYGPHDNFHLEHAHVIPALIHKASLSEKLIVAGSGSSSSIYILGRSCKINCVGHTRLQLYRTNHSICSNTRRSVYWTCRSDHRKSIWYSFRIWHKQIWRTASQDGQ